MTSPRRPDVTTAEIIGGPEALELSLHSYDPRWAANFQEHRRRILDALAGADVDVDVDVEHIGSTAVPGLAAKPIVDIVVAVPDITAEEDYLPGLLVAGYELRVREPGHRLVRTPARDVHVHIYERGVAAVHDYLLLRDHLRADAGDRELYESVKRALMSRRWDDMNDYAYAKTDVIQAIKTRARAGRARPPGYTDALVNLYTRDIDAGLRFYRDLLGFTETFRTPADGRPEHVEFRLGGFTLALGTVEAARRVHEVDATPGAPGMVIVVWTGDVDAAVAALRAAGVPVLKEPHDAGNGNRNALVRDPDGNLVEIVAKISG
ncbi:GrpB family protein [Symbioplanes lichenis]|uniref:GrpB family protein n=1 Tax=Symbioplanes lichenis TaxID=1629072 RepID=UPI0027394267|nr:GrpB family protein [Actinoplanes lichenis]